MSSITQRTTINGQAYRRIARANYGQPPAIVYQVLVSGSHWRTLVAQVHQKIVARIDANLGEPRF